MEEKACSYLHMSNMCDILHVFFAEFILNLAFPFGHYLLGQGIWLDAVQGLDY